MIISIGVDSPKEAKEVGDCCVLFVTVGFDENENVP
jgi:hypothetical protein